MATSAGGAIFSSRAARVNPRDSFDRASSVMINRRRILRSGIPKFVEMRGENISSCQPDGAQDNRMGTVDPLQGLLANDVNAPECAGTEFTPYVL